MYPGGNGFEYFATFFGALNCFNSAGQYDYANTKTCPGATKLMDWLTSFKPYPYAQVNSMNATYGAVAGGDDDPFVAGKEGFNMDGPWEGAQNVPDANPSMVGNFGVVPFPGTVAGPSTIGQGNFNIIPKGAADPTAAFEFITCQPDDCRRPRLPGLCEEVPMDVDIPGADVKQVLPGARPLDARVAGRDSHGHGQQ
jgi:ABC-type glycerol-3-phosphate transport system substrate-binding protein